MKSDSGTGCQRVVIENISPEVDGGRFPVKRIAGDIVDVEAVIYADGHDTLLARLRYRHEKDRAWREAPLQSLSNDRWRGSFTAARMGKYYFSITAWVDRFETWRKDLRKRYDTGQMDLSLQFITGAGLIEKTLPKASRPDVSKIKNYLDMLNSEQVTRKKKVRLALSEVVRRLMAKYSERRFAISSPELAITVDRSKAGFSAWYEMFPRSASPEPGRHGTFRDVEARLPYVAGMGFDVLYLPPIHPIGNTRRKGKNNAVTARRGDPGTPWAIGSREGGFKAIHPGLGTLEDFRHLLAAAGDHGLEIALDIAFQCSPDHPYVQKHPGWFLRRPDGTVQFAENPPKKYQDIYPLNFESEDWRGLWEELKGVILYWAGQGVRIFRVDNPHTKPFCFWEWIIGEVKREYPDVILLAEAFTRPVVMYRLAKLGFTQSYTYFTWRNHKRDLTEYLVELTQTGVKDFFRPNFWPNTPDILHEYLQKGGRPAFMARLVLAATLCSNYGIYGPAFELLENTPREPGSEEYLNSEKYELKLWDIDRPDSLRDFIASVNRARRQNPALQRNLNLWFNFTSNDNLLCYSKHTADLSNIILVVVSLGPQGPQSGTVNVPLNAWGLNTDVTYQVHDLLSDARYNWTGEWNPVTLDPEVCPAHVFHIVDSAGLKRKD
ncbi:MAG: alpha-1,4-glucan--maltose-1-phosphate maltosyltransferase [Chloroflexi bacterium RBG_16_56_11]|nr:MAG: alpha-1,4-glucan--maltose-1-phosphate maltosyltransferase [Chloroflexi bacterium RBG_16_56_11]